MERVCRLWEQLILRALVQLIEGRTCNGRRLVDKAINSLGWCHCSAQYRRSLLRSSYSRQRLFLRLIQLLLSEDQILPLELEISGRSVVTSVCSTIWWHSCGEVRIHHWLLITVVILLVFGQDWRCAWNSETGTNWLVFFVARSGSRWGWAVQTHFYVGSNVHVKLIDLE